MSTQPPSSRPPDRAVTSGHVLVHADVREAIRALPDRSIRASVSSIPYWGRRSYLPGDDRELGVEPLWQYLENVADVYDLMAPKLERGAMVWINIGDTSAHTGGAGGDYYNESGGYAAKERYRPPEPLVWVRDPYTLEGFRLHDLAAGQKCDVPGRLAHELQTRGWRLRAKVVWSKLHPKREAIKQQKRPKEQHETILLLTRDEVADSLFFSDDEKLGDVWEMDVARGHEAKGDAPWPSALPARMLRLSGEPGVAFDPFVGAGNSYLGADQAGWRLVGADLSDAQVALCVERGFVAGPTGLESLPAALLVPPAAAGRSLAAAAATVAG